MTDGRGGKGRGPAGQLIGRARFCFVCTLDMGSLDVPIVLLLTWMFCLDSGDRASMGFNLCVLTMYRNAALQFHGKRICERHVVTKEPQAAACSYLSICASCISPGRKENQRT